MDESQREISDALIRRVRAGDEEAGDELVKLVYPSVIALVRRHIRRVADQQDVVQEVVLKVFLKIDQYRGPQPFAHWVSRLTIRTCIDWLRKCRGRPAVTCADLGEAGVHLLEAVRDGTPPGALEVEREILNGLLDRLIALLKPNEQIVIRLLDLEECSVQEVREQTGWSASKIKSLAMRARRKLSSRVRRLEGDGES